MFKSGTRLKLQASGFPSGYHTCTIVTIFIKLFDHTLGPYGKKCYVSALIEVLTVICSEIL